MNAGAAIVAEHDPLADLAEPPPEMPADDSERLELLLAELPALAPARCRCERPLIGADDHGAAQCWLCGHAPRASADANGTRP